MICLVTGGAGFIGSHLVDRLLLEKHEVICLDNFDPYYNPSIKREHIKSAISAEKFSLVEGDIRNRKQVEDIVKDNSVEIIYHLAAQAGVRVSIENPSKTHDINATGTLNILEAARSLGVKKVINASSSSVYGKMKYLPFDEEHPKNPVSPYGASKVAAEHYCRIFYEIYGLRTTSLRYFTVYGERIRPDLAISIFTKKALNSEPIEIYGDGNYTRDFTYIDDAVQATILAMNKGDGEIYNIGSGKRITINGLAEKIIAITGNKSKIIHTAAKKGEAEHTLANIEKAKKGLGWEPKIDITDGLKLYVDIKGLH
ncbi:MAG: SDR family oxidoreductase [Candidatus Methanoperedens sp.]|nr:SDR family oxidoreductase [Candidatus Methanoperedens sp.]